MSKAIKYWIIGLSIPILLYGCSPQNSYAVKTFFFDGVPNPFEQEVVEEEVVLDTLAELADYINELNPVQKEPEWYAHSPWQEANCNGCHNQGRLGKLVMPKEELCYSCHKGFGDNYSTLHGPVAAASCTECHDPHRSQVKGLLVQQNETLCLQCHEETRILTEDLHTNIDEKNCTDCHDPHGGPDKNLLRQGSCYQCHDNYADKFQNVHGPVASANYCFTCHEDHASKRPNNLSQPIGELCLSCHEKKDVYASTAHSTVKNKKCTDCHNPHGSDQPFLLTQSR